MKHILAAGLALFLILSVAACSSGAPSPTAEPSPNPNFKSSETQRIVRLGDYYYYVSSRDEIFYRCNLDGSEPEPVEPQGKRYNRVAVVDGMLYWVCDNILHRKDPESGKSEELLRGPTGNFAVSDGRVYFSDIANNVLVEHDIETGERKTHLPEGYDPFRSFAFIDNMIFYFAKGEKNEHNGIFRSYNLLTGETRDEYPGEYNYSVTFCVDDQYLYIGIRTLGAKLVTIDRVTGEATTRSVSNKTDRFYLMGERLYVTMPDGIVEIDDKGRELQTLTPNKRIADSGLYAVDRYFFVYDPDDEFDSLVKADGTEKIEFQR